VEKLVLYIKVNQLRGRGFKVAAISKKLEKIGGLTPHPDPTSSEVLKCYLLMFHFFRELMVLVVLKLTESLSKMVEIGELKRGPVPTFSEGLKC
jgi:hypothetical protein